VSDDPRSTDTWLSSPLRPEDRPLRGGRHTLLSAVMEGSIDGIVTFVPVRDGSGRVVDFRWVESNPAAATIAGYPPEGLVGRTLLELFPSDEMARLVRRYVNVLETGEAFALEVTIPRNDGSCGWFHVNCLRYQDADAQDAGDRDRLVVICRDTTSHRDQASLLADIRHQHQILQRQALHDPLTGLANRLLLDTRLEHALARLERMTSAVAVMFLDVDGLKQVNDRFGHRIGDLLLTELARRLERNGRPYDTVARIGGDEFVVVCEDVNPPEVPRIAHRLLDACAAPFDLAGQRIAVSSSIGITISDGGHDADSLIVGADQAMYRAKQAGGNRIVLSSDGLGALVDDRYDVERSLPAAIERNELAIGFDPIVRSSDRRIAAADVRVRWDHPARGHLDHATLHTVAESVHALEKLQRWLVIETIEELHRHEIDPQATPIVLVVDLVEEFLRSNDFVSWLSGQLGRRAVPPSRLCIGIDDDALSDVDPALAAVIDELNQLGVRLGRLGVGGTASPGRYIQTHPIQYARFAPGVVASLDGGEDIVARAIVEIAHERGRTLVAAGVDGPTRYEMLRELGVDLLQGPYLAPPVTAEALRAMLRELPTG
jgi:diguanylate cyclase (GGDEF)-like protein/PAS domain S-box-containing protein